MFTNNKNQVEEMKQALSNNEIIEIYHYDKLGKQDNTVEIIEKDIVICDYCDLHKYHKNPNLEPITRKGIVAKFKDGSWFKFCNNCFNGRNLNYLITEMCNKYQGEIPIYYQGTGRILAKYRVVEVSNLGEGIHIKYNHKYNYTLKLEKIEECNIALNEFVSYSYAKENYDYCVKRKYREKGFDKYILDIKNDKTFRKTRYNGLTKVIYIGSK